MLSSVLWAVIVILVVLWLLGVVAQIDGGLIHLLLVVTFVNLLTGRSTV